jgi:pimeloyl-ACP methyl ester carboxylesterase
MGSLRSVTEQITYPANGMTVHALAWGPVDGPLALCLHGYPDTAWTWRHLGPYLAERGWRVVAPFTRGYGPSDLAPDNCYQVGALASDAVAAHEALHGDGRAVLIGHDWGAITAYPAAAHSPERFAKVVTLAVPPLGAVGGKPPHGLRREAALLTRQSRRSWYLGFQQLPVVSERSLARLMPRLWAVWSPGYDAAEDLAHVFEALDSPARRNAALRYYRALARPWTHSTEYAEYQRHWLELPASPVLYLHGDQDGCMLVDLASRAAPILTGDSRMEVVSGAGHFLQLERPDVVNSLISEFIT